MNKFGCTLLFSGVSILLYLIMPIHKSGQYTTDDTTIEKPYRQNFIATPIQCNKCEEHCAQKTNRVNYSLRDCHTSSFEAFILIFSGAFVASLWWLILYNP